MKCDSCPATTDATLARARIKGWHIFDGLTQGGTEVHWILCPACVGRRRQQERAPAVLPGQEELF